MKAKEVGLSNVTASTDVDLDITHVMLSQSFREKERRKKKKDGAFHVRTHLKGYMRKSQTRSDNPIDAKIPNKLVITRLK